MDNAFCPHCKSTSILVGSWRFNGEAWEHRCDDMPPQAGHFVIDLKAAWEELEQERDEQKRRVIDFEVRLSEERVHARDAWGHVDSQNYASITEREELRARAQTLYNDLWDAYMNETAIEWCHRIQEQYPDLEKNRPGHVEV